MNRTHRCVPILALSILSGCAVMTFDPSAKGRRDAARDISAGQMVILVYGRPAPWRADFLRILETDYGISSRYVMNDSDYATAYNRTMEQEFERVFGVDVVEVASDKALAAYRASTVAQTQPSSEGDEP